MLLVLLIVSLTAHTDVWESVTLEPMRVNSQLWPWSSASAQWSRPSSSFKAFTHSLRFWSAVCPRLLLLKRSWQPLIITRAEPRAFLCVEILRCVQPYRDTQTDRAPGLLWFSSCLTNDSQCYVLWEHPIMTKPVWGMTRKKWTFKWGWSVQIQTDDRNCRSQQSISTVNQTHEAMLSMCVSPLYLNLWQFLRLLCPEPPNQCDFREDVPTSLPPLHTLQEPVRRV